jgi:hypothetical protein
MGESVTVPDPANDWLDCAGAVLRTQQDRERLQLVSALENVGARHLVDPHRSDWSDLTMQSRSCRSAKNCTGKAVIESRGEMARGYDVDERGDLK